MAALIAMNFFQQVQGQQLPNAPAKGETQNTSITNGSRTSLSVGNSTAFGASTNLTASVGLVAVSRSVLIPTEVSVKTAIGGTSGSTIINISNLTAKGDGNINPESNGIGAGSTIQAEETQFASGIANIQGMTASADMFIQDTGEASFYSTVHPHIEDTACSPTNAIPCLYKANDGLVSGNAAASANLSTQTNIDIQANSFTQSFAQSF
ncbi:hypothetical protein [Synechococcus sp. 8F6]|uniref:hypothetical protein n=1 Tax=Synechococcus sp. 8F6 TaxID=2025606 RepID=UPI00117C3CAA|nr:hypothetical protein [Synechococcus sp. 8F6]